MRYYDNWILSCSFKVFLCEVFFGEYIRVYLSFGHPFLDLKFLSPFVLYEYNELQLPLGGLVERLLWRHNRRDGVSNNQPHDCLLNRLFRHRSKKTSKLSITAVCAGIHRWPQMASNTENVSIWWRHHEVMLWQRTKSLFSNLCL